MNVACFEGHGPAEQRRELRRRRLAHRRTAGRLHARRTRHWLRRDHGAYRSVLGSGQVAKHRGPLRGGDRRPLATTALEHDVKLKRRRRCAPPRQQDPERTERRRLIDELHLPLLHQQLLAVGRDELSPAAHAASPWTSSASRAASGRRPRTSAVRGRFRGAARSRLAGP